MSRYTTRISSGRSKKEDDNEGIIYYEKLKSCSSVDSLSSHSVVSRSGSTTSSSDLDSFLAAEGLEEGPARAPSPSPSPPRRGLGGLLQRRRLAVAARSILAGCLALLLLCAARKTLTATTHQTSEAVHDQRLVHFVENLELQPPYSLSYRSEGASARRRTRTRTRTRRGEGPARGTDGGPPDANSAANTANTHDKRAQYSPPPNRPASWEAVENMAAQVESMAAEYILNDTPKCPPYNQRMSLYAPVLNPSLVRSSPPSPLHAGNGTKGVRTSAASYSPDEPHGFFIALILYNNQQVIATLLKELPKLASYLGRDRVFVSIYENGSTDMSPQLLLLLANRLREINVDFEIIAKGTTEPHEDASEPSQVAKEEGGEDQDVSLSGRVRSSSRAPTSGSGSTEGTTAKEPTPFSRVARLAALRNRVLEPLFASVPTKNEVLASFLATSEFPELPPPNKQYKHVLFLNDVHFCMEDALELLYQQELQGTDMTCGLDFFGNSLRRDITGLELYDTWVARTIDGQYLSTPETLGRIAALHPPSRERYLQHQPFQVFSCWNGIVAIDAKYFFLPNSNLYSGRGEHAKQVESDTGVRFRSINESDYASESYLINVDLWKLNQLRQESTPRSDLQETDDSITDDEQPAPTRSTRIVMVPRVKVAYTTSDYEMILAEKEALRHEDHNDIATLLSRHEGRPNFDLVEYQRDSDRIRDDDWISQPPAQVEFHPFNKMRGLFEESTYRAWDDVY